MLSDTMAGTFARSYQLVKESWAILKQDKNGGDSGCFGDLFYGCVGNIYGVWLLFGNPI